MSRIHQGIVAAALGAAVLMVGSFDVATAGGGGARSGGMGHNTVGAGFRARAFIGGRHIHMLRHSGHHHLHVSHRRGLDGFVSGVPLYGYPDSSDIAPVADPDSEPAIDSPVDSQAAPSGTVTTTCKHSVETVHVPTGDGTGGTSDVTIYRC